jgi:ATP-dependent RNA helicase RhlE
MGPQERALKAGVDIVVATPGRLLDHMRSSVGDYSALEIFVLDEADRMMDMGFWPDVRKIAEALRPAPRGRRCCFPRRCPKK